VSAAEERVKGDLVLEAIAEREGLTVGQEEIDREVERLAKEARSNVQEVRRLLAGESGAFTGLRATLLREKTLDWLHTRAKFREEEGAAGGQEPK
jgi:trigger factor